jgi:hypothetical protein
MAPRRPRPAVLATNSTSTGDNSEEQSSAVTYGLDADAYGQDQAGGDAGAEHGGHGSAVDGYNEDADGEWQDAGEDDVEYEQDGADGENQEVGGYGAAGEQEDAENSAAGENQEDAEYDESNEYDDSNEYDEYEEADSDADASDSNGKAFTPPTALSAIKNAFRSPRQRAQPATGTAEDAQRVNFIDKRERLIGYFLGVLLVALAVTSYLHFRHVVLTNIKLQNEYRHEAPWVLLITLGLAVLIFAATLSKRRAALGFTLLLAGLADFTGDFLVGLIFLGAGFWLVFRSMKRSPRRAAQAASRAGSGRADSGRPATVTKAESRAAMAAAGRARAESTSSRSSGTTIRGSTSGRTIGKNGRIASTTTSGRYTPPKPTRHVPPAVQPEPEPTNRLSSWLKK